MFDENSMAARILSGDEDAFGRMVDWYEPTVYQYALGFLGSASGAEEATREIFLRVYAELARKRADVRLSIWVFRIAINVCADQQRHVRSSRRRDGEERTLNEEIQRQLVHLQRQQREILLLHDLCGFSDEDTAQILGLSEEAIRLRLSRGRKNLRELLRRQNVLDTPEHLHAAPSKECQGYRELCSQYVDEYISDADKEKLLNHIQECKSCAAYLNDLTIIGRALVHMQEEKPPEKLHEKILETAHRQADQVQSSYLRANRLPYIIGVVVTAVFLALICSGVLGGLFVNNQSTAAVEKNAGSAERPVELSDDLTIPDAVTGESYAFVLAAAGEIDLPELSGSATLIAGDEENSVEYYTVKNDISLVQELTESLESMGYRLESVNNTQIVITSGVPQGLIIIMHEE